MEIHPILVVCFIIVVVGLVGYLQVDRVIVQPTIAEEEQVFRAPPEITITINNETYEAIQGTYSWTYKNKDGSITGREADSDVPSRYMVDYEAWNVQADTEVEVNFDRQPIDYHIKRWDEDTHTSESHETIDLTEQEGIAIYEIVGRWPEGTASYAFKLNVEEIE
ncbi:hypothetical protein RYX56_01000 [Alkalihalophilus lindianensis]|uniref:Uncharacterized protein n=1 Tax=Alkalihalophilus lindianensis TaxID=1630542 RepID=A0ABU3X4X1_9BACI|nr:hypothetical protein [Alkalihalophilus lindianensis]MDV2682943.1 hypothetical protein [Alkalihalophilus lindianensis]